MRSLLSGLFRLVLLAAFTFAFVVLFEHGPSKFSEGAKTEWNALAFFAGSMLLKHDKAPPGHKATSPAPASDVSSPNEGAANRSISRPAQATPAPGN